MKIFVIDNKTNEREEITDLYWFEENFVHSFYEHLSASWYRFEFEIEDKDVIINGEKESTGSGSL
jgi:hypothetical protein